jgi:hypothetical protein
VSGAGILPSGIVLTAAQAAALARLRTSATYAAGAAGACQPNDPYVQQFQLAWDSFFASIGVTYNVLPVTSYYDAPTANAVAALLGYRPPPCGVYAAPPPAATTYLRLRGGFSNPLPLVFSAQPVRRPFGR